MIEKLDIENFMLFKKLEIPTLKRVNLIGGRNNAGKTTLLEAIRILTSHGNIKVINDILNNREVLVEGYNLNFEKLFCREALKDVIRTTLNINELLIERLLPNGEFGLYGLKIGDQKPIPLSFNVNYYPKENNTFIPFNYNFHTISNLWEHIVLTPKEEDLIKIIQNTIEPNLQRLDVGQNIVRVKLNKLKNPIPLGTLGDGVQRILLIALGLANAQNSYLLIDEIELGLHHSVLEKLWKMIFKYAKKWNIQVFVTTHSQDALRTFTYVASEEENKADAQFIRLQIGRTGKNEAILFNTDRLIKMLDLKLEIR